jgi:hypothetical protein
MVVRVALLAVLLVEPEAPLALLTAALELLVPAPLHPVAAGANRRMPLLET